jgi:hypothetical protein
VTPLLERSGTNNTTGMENWSVISRDRKLIAKRPREPFCFEKRE